MGGRRSGESGVEWMNGIQGLALTQSMQPQAPPSTNRDGVFRSDEGAARADEDGSSLSQSSKPT